jgi:glucose 1-dehydrogenase
MIPVRVLITGGASGIGLAAARRFAADATGQASVAIVDRAGVALDAAIAELTAAGAEALPIVGDLEDPSVPARAVAEAVQAFGGLDAVVSNAGINSPGRMLECAVEDWDRVFAVNTRAAWLLAKAAHSALAISAGSIVIVASMSGSNAHANLGPYGPSKAAAIMLMKVLAQEFGPDGIRVNCLSPGMVRTNMTKQVYADNAVSAGRAELVPLGRVAEAADMADVIAFMVSDAARYMNGHDLVVDGALIGNHLGRLPGLTSITKG